VELDQGDDGSQQKMQIQRAQVEMFEFTAEKHQRLLAELVSDMEQLIWF
jgi:hypothetical protein